MPLHHAGATCAMGRKHDTRAVVDFKPCVYDVQNLRVIDVSALPIIPPGHPQSTVYKLEEMIADDILSDH